MNNISNNYNEWKHEYRGNSSTATLALGFFVWFAHSVYSAYTIWEVYNATDYLGISRFSYYLYTLGGKELLYIYYSILPMAFVLATIKQIQTFIKNK
jgi:TRAP-type C4-dicarboxylate transport system permease small subunit